MVPIKCGTCESGTRQVILQYNTIQSHVIKGTKDIIYLLGWGVLPHAVYSLNLGSLDYDLFRSLQRPVATMWMHTLKV
ncbi:hypothetical protein X777_11895 [Ooceraea biroi]|uniref:Uncharacterized protein n=1 Tax=Ooceraea biroi TaxID=2015173 RepID=A0A026W055_OOCBI|nr:hypothetical protein X777_11895 [Ooceraea biroi]